MSLPEVIRVPFFNDMHVHLRQGMVLPKSLSAITFSYCQHFMAMPNTVPPIQTAGDVDDYIKAACGVDDPPPSHPIRHAMRVAVILNAKTTPTSLERAISHEAVLAAKLYPDGVTTNSEGGIRDFSALHDLCAVLEDHDKVLCVHAEHPEAEVLDREEMFLDEVLMPIRQRHPRLRLVVEHITQENTVNWVAGNPQNTAATVTPHHLLLTLDDVIGDKGLQPRNYCKPIAKRRLDRAALLLGVWNYENFFLGSDSAPHSSDKKFGDCGCAGCFTSPILPPLVVAALAVKAAQMFEGDKQLQQKIADFTSKRAAAFYHLPEYESELEISYDPSEQGHGRTLLMMEGTTWPVFQAPTPLQWKITKYTPPRREKPLQEEVAESARM